MKPAIAGALLCALLSVPAYSATIESLTEPVRVTGGEVAGVITDGLNVYKGIPFAAPPVRENRWRDPQPVVPWNDTLIADQYSPMCLQSLRAKNSVFYQGEEPTSEDCLYLNVWTEDDAEPGDKRPVMVFVYGGGWEVGSGSMPIYAGDGLADKGAVVVTFNYRVGTLGFFAHPELSSESADGTSGNYGLKDMIAALKWVNSNIEGFGGDPENITVYGQSAGSAAISLLLASPEAEGLIDAAIGQSGGFGMSANMKTLAEAEADGLAYAEKAKVTSIAALRNLSGDAILANGNGGRPILDGRVFTEQPAATYAEGRQMHVPVLVGSNADEGTVYPVVRSAVDLTADLKREFGDAADEALRVYPASTDAEARVSSYNLFRDRVFASSVMRWASAQANVAPTYVYYFSHVQPFVDGLGFQQQADTRDLGAYHGSEMVYAYGIVDSINGLGETRNLTDVDRALSDVMSSYWVNFAKSHNPNGSGLPVWAEYDPGAGNVMVFGDTAVAGTFPNSDALRLLAN